jgi:hypothetical protein
MSALTFRPRPRSRSTLTGSKIREWTSADGRYMVFSVTSPWYGTWYRACRIYASGPALITWKRFRKLSAAQQACRRHREQ